MKKRIFSSIVALALCLTLLPTTVLAADLTFAYSADETEDQSGTGYSWDASERTLTLTGDIDGNIILPNAGGNDDEVVTIYVEDDCEVSGTVSFSNYAYANLLITGDSSLKMAGFIKGFGGTRLTVETDVEIQSDLSLGESGGMDSVLCIYGATLTIHGPLTLQQTLIMQEKNNRPPQLKILDGGASFHNTLDATSSSIWPDENDSSSRLTSCLADSSVIEITGDGWQPTLYQESSGSDSDFDVTDLLEGFLPAGYECKDRAIWQTGAADAYTGSITLKKQFTVTYYANGGSGTMAPAVGVAGSHTLPANGFTPPSANHQFQAWAANDPASSEHYPAGSVYNVTADTAFYAVWTTISTPSVDDDSVVTYRVTVEESAHGAVKSSHRRAGGGELVRLTVDPEADYVLAALTVTDSKGNEIETTRKNDGLYTFRMPHRDVTVTAAFESIWNPTDPDCPRDHTCPYWPYTDTDTHAWYHDGVHFCVENELMGGYGNGIFNPNGNVTRQQVWMILARMSGSDPADMAEAADWAVESGVSDGSNPNLSVSRQQFAAMLWRYARYMGYDVSVGEDTNILSYDDAFDVAEYAIPAMQWACGSGVIQGKDAPNGTGMRLDPDGTATRAQLATMMMRFCVEIVK